MDELISYFKDKKNLINLLTLAVMVLALPLGINLVHQQQILTSRAQTTSQIIFPTQAQSGSVTPTGESCVRTVNNGLVTACSNMLVRIYVGSYSDVFPNASRVVSQNFEVVKKAYAATSCQARIVTYCCQGGLMFTGGDANDPASWVDNDCTEDSVDEGKACTFTEQCSDGVNVQTCSSTKDYQGNCQRNYDNCSACPAVTVGSACQYNEEIPQCPGNWRTCNGLDFGSGCEYNESVAPNCVGGCPAAPPGGGTPGGPSGNQCTFGCYATNPSFCTVSNCPVKDNQSECDGGSNDGQYNQYAICKYWWNNCANQTDWGNPAGGNNSTPPKENCHCTNNATNPPDCNSQLRGTDDCGSASPPETKSCTNDNGITGGHFYCHNENYDPGKRLIWGECVPEACLNGVDYKTHPDCKTSGGGTTPSGTNGCCDDSHPCGDNNQMGGKTTSGYSCKTDTTKACQSGNICTPPGANSGCAVFIQNGPDTGDKWVKSIGEGDKIRSGDNVAVSVRNPSSKAKIDDSSVVIKVSVPNGGTETVTSAYYATKRTNVGKYTFSASGGTGGICNNAATAELTTIAPGSTTSGVPNVPPGTPGNSNNCYTCQSGLWTQTSNSNCSVNSPLCSNSNSSTYSGCQGGEGQGSTASSPRYCTGSTGTNCYICPSGWWLPTTSGCTTASPVCSNSNTATYTGGCQGGDAQGSTGSTGSNPRACTGTAASASPASPRITAYRLSETSGVFNTGWTNLDSTQDFASGVNATMNFSTTPGTKYVFVQFKDANGIESQAPFMKASIKLLGLPPTITTGLTCPYNTKTGVLSFSIPGTNFGTAQGTIALTLNGANVSSVQLDSWTDTLIKAHIDSPKTDVADGTGYKITVTAADGQSVTDACGVNISTLSVGSQSLCDPANYRDVPNAKLTILDMSTAGTTKQKVEETVTISKDGLVKNIKTKLQKDKEYVVCVEPPMGLRACSEKFTFSPGTVITKIKTATGDFNKDGCKNSFDIAYLRQRYGCGSGKEDVDVNGDGCGNSFEVACTFQAKFGECNQTEPF